MKDNRLYIEDLDPEKVKEVDYWHVTEDDPDYVNLTATTIDEAVKEWKENVDDDPESVFDSEEEWISNKQNENARITVTAYKRIKHPAPSAENILDDIITNIEESDSCPDENDYRSNKKMLEAAQHLKDVIEEEIDPWYYPVFDVLCFLNKPNVPGSYQERECYAKDCPLHKNKEEPFSFCNASLCEKYVKKEE